MNLLLFEADYSSTESIIDGIKENKIHVKNGKNIVSEPKFKDWLDVVIPSLQKRNIPVSKVFNVLINKSYLNKKYLLSATEYDALKYYVKYRGSPSFKNLFYEFETTQMPLATFHNEAQEIADNTKNGQRALRKAQTNDEDIEVLYDKNGWVVKSPKTWQASVKAATFPFGKAPWCTASSQAETYFTHYTENGKYKLFIISGGTKDKTLQVTFSPDNADLEGWDNDGSVPNLSKFPDDVLKICKSGNRSLYDFKHLNKKYPNIVKTKKDKNGWISKTTLHPFGKDNFWIDFSKYVNGDYDSFDKIKKYIKDSGVDSFVGKEYYKDNKIIKQRDYRGKKIFDKSSSNPDSDFYGIISNASYDKEKDLPRKVKSDIYTRTIKQEKKEKKTDDFAFEKKTISPEDANYNKLFELGISKYGIKKGEDITMTAYFLAPMNTAKRYPVIYVGGVNSKIITSSDKELFKFCMVHYFKKYIKDWQSRGNLLHDVINGNELEEEWKQKVLDILK